MAKQKTFPNYTRLEQAHYDEIKQTEVWVHQLEYAEELAKRQYDTAKRRLKEGTVGLRNLIHAGPGDQPRLPGMDQERMQRETPPKRWEELPIGFAIHDKRDSTALIEFGIETIGQLAKYTNGGGKLIAIGGVDEHGEARIVEQLQLFWESNPGSSFEPKDEGEKNETKDE